MGRFQWRVLVVVRVCVYVFLGGRSVLSVVAAAKVGGWG